MWIQGDAVRSGKGVSYVDQVLTDSVFKAHLRVKGSNLQDVSFVDGTSYKKKAKMSYYRTKSDLIVDPKSIFELTDYRIKDVLSLAKRAEESKKIMIVKDASLLRSEK